MSVTSKSHHTIEFNENNNNLATKKEDHEVTRKYCCWSPGRVIPEHIFVIVHPGL